MKVFIGHIAFLGDDYYNERKAIIHSADELEIDGDADEVQDECEKLMQENYQEYSSYVIPSIYTGEIIDQRGDK